MADIPIRIYDPNEVYFGDTYFPIQGPVKWTNITVTANPTIYGSTDHKGDTQVMSEFIQDSYGGGRGIFRNDVRTDIDRFWTSTCQTRQRRALTLPSLSVDMGKPAALTTENLNLAWNYRNEEYFSFSNKVYRWLDASTAWSALETTLGTVPTSAVTFNNTLYVAYGAGYATRTSGGTWTDFPATPASYFVVWDSKLYRLGQVSGVWTMYNLPAGGAWSASVGAITDDITPQGLVVYRDGNGALVIYVLAGSGLWVYDATNTRFLQTEIRFPVTTDPVVGTVYHDGKLYMSTGGLGLLGIQSGSQFIASPVGLDLEDSVPSTQVGRIVAIASAYNEVMMLVDATLPSSGNYIDSGLGNPFEPHQWYAASGNLTLWAYDGQGWHTAWQQATTQAGSALDVSSAYSKLRVYWSAHGRAYYQALQSATFNPRSNPTIAVEPSCSHTSSWFSFGLDTQRKIHGHLILRTYGCSATETVQVWYGKDLSESWTLLDTITTDGQQVLEVGGPDGDSGYYFRFRFDLARGSTNTSKPVIEFYSSEWMRVLPATYGYSFDLDLTKTHKGRTPMQLAAALERLADHSQTPNLQQFSFQDQLDGSTHTHYARITRSSAWTRGGTDMRGISGINVSVIVPYKQDSLSGG